MKTVLMCAVLGVLVGTMGCAEVASAPSLTAHAAAMPEDTGQPTPGGPWAAYCSCQPQPTCAAGTTLLCNRYNNGFFNVTSYGWECVANELLNNVK
jgi:hypothetical protein